MGESADIELKVRTLQPVICYDQVKIIHYLRPADNRQIIECYGAVNPYVFIELFVKGRMTYRMPNQG